MKDIMDFPMFRYVQLIDNRRDDLFNLKWPISSRHQFG